jgi:hypothetical protein
VYLAQQGNNPFGSLIALYFVFEGSGVRIKLPGEVTLDQTTGQVTATVDNAPELPVEDLRVNFFGGPLAPLVTAPSCGQYSIASELSPWSQPDPASAVVDQSPLPITSGPGGTPCGLSPFAPRLDAGVTDNQAGGSSSFSVTTSRADGEQRLASIQVNTPPGLLGTLKSVPLCPAAQAQAGTCGLESQLGRVTTAAGPGPNPVLVGGKVYLTGPYRGSPFGLAIVVPAVAGPFNLGTVVVRARIDVDRHDGHVIVTSDALPTILQGVPLDVRTVNVTIDRPGFMVNPTNCRQLATAETTVSTAGATAATTASFRVANCAKLPFKPVFTAVAQARTSRLNGAGLKVSIKSAPGQANIGKVKVELPRRLPSRLTTLQKSCVEQTFAVNPASCSSSSIVGVARATTPLLANPLTGPAYLVSHGGRAFPDLDIVLQGEGVTLYQEGNTNIRKGITETVFNTVPDAPISTFELTLPVGRHSALAAFLPNSAHESLCGQKLVMPTFITGQNGVKLSQSTKIAISGCIRARATRARHVRSGKRRKGHR